MGHTNKDDQAPTSQDLLLLRGELIHVHKALLAYVISECIVHFGLSRAYVLNLPTDCPKAKQKCKKAIFLVSNCFCLRTREKWPELGMYKYVEDVEIWWIFFFNLLP